ncbi:MAG: hypothetical protein A2831_02240 [Candidatus Yanofskybacteria bacterium RIFCSPHIGHO2_01_FULL_44_17]|uniref:Methyltransferase domain-containing protein n=1 Tax=Candidatus Yanofskybacteria bacterium RIFCSPHIGHO2_01_FULL_44_17 TaxID=1802668 RepID=A0A1F8EUD5_9BACT|nr:MAG: hypothetical protein A2831_02240 [Candidatus Yanofskybacteria bacterium RIFCSPHIGHO2_01_FULL_44_17]
MDPIWNKIHKGGWGKYPNEALVRFLCRYKKAEPDFKRNNKVLDLGCGAGANTKMMVAEGFKVWAVDGAGEAVRHAKAFVSQKNTKFIVADFVDIASIFPKGFFDIVCDNVSVYTNTVKNIEAILASVAKILKKDGLFYSSCFSTKTLGCGLGKKLESGTFIDIRESVFFKDRGIAHFYTEKEARKVYGKFFTVQSFDVDYHTEFNGQNTVSMFVLICRKK